MNDLISRQAAIDAIHEDILLKPHNDSWFRANHEFVTVGYVERTLLAVPSAQPEPRWIPCSERLPEARRSVILSTKNWTGEGCYWETTAHHVIWKGYRWNATYWDDEVIAWMPLPEPYKEGADE